MLSVFCAKIRAPSLGRLTSWWGRVIYIIPCPHCGGRYNRSRIQDTVGTREDVVKSVPRCKPSQRRWYLGLEKCWELSFLLAFFLQRHIKVYDIVVLFSRTGRMWDRFHRITGAALAPAMKTVGRKGKNQPSSSRYRGEYRGDGSQIQDEPSHISCLREADSDCSELSERVPGEVSE